MTDSIYVMNLLRNVSQPFHWVNEASDNNIEDTQAPNSISKKLETENVFSWCNHLCIVRILKISCAYQTGNTSREVFVWIQSVVVINKQNISKAALFWNEIFGLRFVMSLEMKFSYFMIRLRDAYLTLYKQFTLCKQCEQRTVRTVHFLLIAEQGEQARTLFDEACPYESKVHNFNYFFLPYHFSSQTSGQYLQTFIWTFDSNGLIARKNVAICSRMLKFMF